MKIFASWLIGALVAFGILGGAYHLSLTGAPRKIAVIVDSSYPMTSVWHRLPALLAGLGSERYSSFSLLTEKNAVHGWKDRLEFGRMIPYGPRNFGRLLDEPIPEITQASKIYFVTNAPADELDSPDGWTIIRP